MPQALQHDARLAAERFCVDAFDRVVSSCNIEPVLKACHALIEPVWEELRKPLGDVAEFADQPAVVDSVLHTAKRAAIVSAVQRRMVPPAPT